MNDVTSKTATRTVVAVMAAMMMITLPANTVSGSSPTDSREQLPARHSTEFSLYLASIAAAERALRLDETNEARAAGAR